MSAGLEIRGVATGLLDDPLLLRTRGGGSEQEVWWRARYRDDNERVWRSSAASAPELSTGWELGKRGDQALAALQSLRPVSIDVRAELPDGRGCNRTLTRSLLGEGVRARRWRDGLAATLYLPAPGGSCATALLDATAGSDADVATRALEVATLAGALLASRGVLVLVVRGERGGAARKAAKTDMVLATARERLAAVPGVTGEIPTLGIADPLSGGTGEGGEDVVVLPPGVGVEGGPERAQARAAVWDELLSRLGARPRAATAEPVTADPHQSTVGE